MATVLSVGDIAIVQYNSSTTDSFTFVFTRDVEAGTSVSFTDNGWLAAGGFRAGEGTVTYTAAAAVTAGTIVTLTGLNLDDAGDQIIAYQGDPATPTILHVVDLADGNNTVAGDATNDNTTALPPGFTLDLNAVAVGFDNALYAGPTSGSRAELSRAVSNSANWINSDSLATLFKIVERPDIDLDADNSTTGGRNYRAFVTSGGPAVRIADSDIDISDLDGDAIFAAEIHIRLADFGDVLSVNGALPTGITASLDPLTGVLTLSGEASHDAYEAAIRQIEFSTTQPIGTQKRIDVFLFDGQEWGPEAKAFITVGNDILGSTAAPVLDLDADDSNGGGADYTATFASGGPEIPVADTDVSITDADPAAIVSATITLGINREIEDVLSFTGPAGPITAAYDSAAGILTLTGSATLAEYQTALRQVVFSTTSTFTADRIIQVTVNDGTFDSNVGTTYMHVVANDPPALNLDADSSTIGGVDYLTTFVDGGPAVAIVDTDVLITDSDDIELTSATVTLTNPDTDDVLQFNGTPPPGITASLYDPLTGTLTLTGTASLAAYQTALQQITFDNTGTTPSTDSRIIDVVVNDGTAASNLAHAIIHVAQVDNVAPVVNLDADDSTVVGTSFRATFTEGGAPIPIADIDTLITDTDSTTLASATVTLTDPQAGDLLTATLPPGDITASAYDPVTGILTLSGVASLADYETALEAIRFSAAGANPVAGSRIVEVVVNDGANNSQAATALLTVVAINDTPALVVADASYQENADPVLLSPAAILTDADDTELNFAAVQITGGSFPGDGDILTVGGDPSGTGITFTWDPSQHALVFTGASSVANYQALLQTVAFESTSDNPTDFNASSQRTLTWSVSDGAAVTTTTTTLNIVAVNDAPQETVAATAAYTENGPPVTISPAATASDVDNLDLVFGVVRIAGGWVDGDVLTVNGLQSGTFAGIDFSYDAALHALVFRNPAPVADFQALMQAVQFGSTSENPTNFGANPTRTLGWGLHDGDDYSSPVQFTQIVINALDDPAVAQNDAVPTTEDAVTAGNVFANNGFGLDNDLDGGAFLVTAVSGGTLGAPFALPSGALLTLNADGTFSYDPNHMFDYLPTPDSGASNLTITDTFTYTITGGDTATVTVTVSGVDTDDILLDSPGDDSLAGGIGEDRYHVNNTFDVVIEAANAGFVDTVVATVDYTLPANNTVERLDMVGSGLTGTGSEGPETLISDGGPNTLIGLGGNDTYYVNHIDDVVIEAANGGSDIVAATVDYTLPLNNSNVEALYMLGSGLTGTGSGGTETLVSSDGPNTLVGLGGDDTYHVNNTDDVVTEAENGGYDTVAATVTYTMPANVEALYMYGSELTGTGSANNDILVSSGGPNTLVGFDGHDTYYVSNTDDVVTEVADGGSDTVVATVDYTMPDHVEALYVNGSELTGTGSSGADTLYTLGANTLVGDDGNDTFVFYAGSADGAIVADFDGNQVNEEDFLVFSGFGTQAQGATFSPIVGTTDQWQIHSGLDGHNETITFSNHAAPQAGDFLFV